jgi:polyphosphate glucokinase
VDALTAPDLVIIGGGISRKADKFLPLLTSLRATVVAAAMQNDAGIVGAAVSAGLNAAAG